MGPVTIDQLHADLVELKRDMAFVKRILSEDFELSAEATRALKEARSTPESDYVDFE